MYKASKDSPDIVTLNNFMEIVNKKHIGYGQSLYIDKKVKAEERENGNWLAFVEDGLIFQVNIRITDKIIITRCECGCLSQSTFCRHSVAVFYAIGNRLGLYTVD